MERELLEPERSEVEELEEQARREQAAALGRELAALRRKVRRVCALPGCGREFEGTVRRLYCCHQHAALGSWRAKKARMTGTPGASDEPPPTAAPAAPPPDA